MAEQTFNSLAGTGSCLLPPETVAFATVRRWFDGTDTYHTVELWHPNGWIGKSEITYGYADAWKTTALEMIRKNLWDGDRDSFFSGLTAFMAETGWRIGWSVTDVSRKRDL